MNASTAILLALILVAAFFAIRRLFKRGMCDCGDHYSEGSCTKKGCTHCSAAENMVAKMDRHLS